MSYIYREARVASSDGKSSLHTEIYIPESREPIAVIQLAHGMIDYVGRYRLLAEYLTERGFVFAGADHLGHGDSVASAEERGYFAKRDGYKIVVDDLKRVNDYLCGEFPGLPVILFGHSMGSFLSRLYAVKYPRSISGLVIHGTAGKNPVLPFGILLTKIIKAFRGEWHRSAFVRSLAEGGYNKKFDKSEGEGAWLTRDGAMVADRPTNPKTSFTFTLSGYLDLFRMLGECSKREWFKAFPKEMPTLIMSGERDPVGGFGKGVRFVYEGIENAGATKLSLKMYEGARHELFNETNRDEVFGDLASWISSTLGDK